MDTAPRLLLSLVLAVLLPGAMPKFPIPQGNVPHSSAYDSPQQPSAQHNSEPHSRQKRLLWITNDGRLALPPGTTMTITPSLSTPFVRHPPKGFLSNMSVSFPFTIDFDKLGLTDNENPYGTLPPVFARSMGRAAASMLTDYVGQYLDRRRGKRSTSPPITEEMEKAMLSKLHGGERALLYGVAEDLLSNFGLDGRECLLRAICEVQAHPLTNFGLLGEIMKLFFTPSKSPFSSQLREYVAAEKAGGVDGECWPYFRLCPKSIFQPRPNKYSKTAEDQHRREEHENQIVEEFRNVKPEAM